MLSSTGERRRLAAALLAAVALLAFGGTRSVQAQPRIAGIEAAGGFTTYAQGWGRDAGYSARVGSRILWLFGDTFTPDSMRCATAAWSSPDRPLSLAEEVDALGAPYQLYRYSPAEWDFNRAHADPPSCCSEHSRCAKDAPYCNCPKDTDCAARIALWPGNVIALDDRTAVTFYEKVIAGVAPYDFRHLGTGLARIARERTVAMRDRGPDGEPLLVFSDREPNFLHAAAAEENGQRFAYVFATKDRFACAVNVVAGRVPLDRVADRAAYRFWDGTDWTGRLDAARPILSGIAGGLGPIAWNTHLDRWVSAHSDVCTQGKLHLRSAPRPEGPWSEAAVVDLAPLGATVESYAGMLHPALGNGREMWFSFYKPDGEHGALRLGKIRFE